MPVEASQNGQDQARGKKGACEDCRASGQHIRGTPAGQEPTGRAYSKAAPFGFLQQHKSDHGDNDHKMNDDDQGLHGSFPLRVKDTPAFCKYRNVQASLHDPTRHFYGLRVGRISAAEAAWELRSGADPRVIRRQAAYGGLRRAQVQYARCGICEWRA